MTTVGSTTARRWKVRPEGSNWGDFGDDDQVGRMNLVTPQKVLEGIREVREGLNFELSLPLDLPGGAVLNANRHPPILRPTLRRGQVNFNCLLNAGRPDILSDDLVVLHTQYSTQWDGLSHAGSRFDADADGLPEIRYYNGFTAQDMQAPESVDGCGTGGGGAPLRSTSHARALGVERLARTCVQGVGLLIDLAKHFGTGRVKVDHAMLQRALDADGVVVGPGDMVCLHTGFAQTILDMKGAPDAAVLNNTGAVLDGRDPALLDWITRSGVAAIAADNYSIEDFPAAVDSPCCSVLPLHEHCLFKLGVHLGELWLLTELAQALRQRGRHRFLLTAPPLDLPGAVGSPVTPVATI